MHVETDLHEWLADGVTYEFLPDEIAEKSYKSLIENKGHHPIGEECVWEFAEQMKKLFIVPEILQHRSTHSD